MSYSLSPMQSFSKLQITFLKIIRGPSRGIPYEKMQRFSRSKTTRWYALPPQNMFKIILMLSLIWPTNGVSVALFEIGKVMLSSLRCRASTSILMLSLNDMSRDVEFVLRVRFVIEIIWMICHALWSLFCAGDLL